MRHSLTNPASALETAHLNVARDDGHRGHAHGPSEGRRSLLDRMGAVLGFLCAVHCLAVPFILGALPALGFLADHTFDMAIIGVATVVAVLAARSGLRTHGDKRVVFGFAGAIGLLVLGHALGEDGLVGRIPSVIGGFALFGLHLVNLRLSRRKACC